MRIPVIVLSPTHWQGWKLMLFKSKDESIIHTKSKELSISKTKSKDYKINNKQRYQKQNAKISNRCQNANKNFYSVFDQNALKYCCMD